MDKTTIYRQNWAENICMLIYLLLYNRLFSKFELSKTISRVIFLFFDIINGTEFLLGKVSDKYQLKTVVAFLFMNAWFHRVWRMNFFADVNPLAYCTLGEFGSKIQPPDMQAAINRSIDKSSKFLFNFSRPHMACVQQQQHASPAAYFYERWLLRLNQR